MSNIPSVKDFEKLGVFYLGERATDDATPSDLVLYDAKDLTTHAVIIGMTGSGKTGLGIDLLEEAALDHVPVIAIDPKGDMGNLLLTFPNLEASDFRPWINTSTATDKGLTPDEFAAQQAELWKKGLAASGQSGERIAKFRDSVELAIYTPGSSAGLPISVLRSFAPPDSALRDDADLYNDRLQATASGILSLIGIDADPVSSREHILISHLLDHAWQANAGLDIASLIGGIQNPPLKTVGVMTVDAFFPPKDRVELATKLNNLLAAPGFDAWMQGEPLSTKNLLYTASGKPRLSVVSIAHLDDSQRMFFVAMLLNDIIAWMRAQQGTTSLRAILYMDEIFGYLPPVANPPTKRLFLTLLKQARAYGLGLVLATQNPVDLDYKGLSNTGTWFIGRLQTERDKARVMEGLEGASQGGTFDKASVERTLAGLGQRHFLLHNVHEDADVVFGTRWAMSYLAGPMTRTQIKALMQDKSSAATSAEPVAASAVPTPDATTDAPVLPPQLDQYFLSCADTANAADVVLYPRLLGAARLAYASASYHVEAERSAIFTAEIDDGPDALNWDDAERMTFSVDELRNSAEPNLHYAELGANASDPKNYAAWQREYTRWLRQNDVLTLFKSAKQGMSSNISESEGDFRTRLQHAANETRDLDVEKLRKRYVGSKTTLESRLLRAQQAVQREQQQSTQKKLDTAVSIGTAIFGAVFGRKHLTASTASKIGTAVRKVGSTSKESADVARAEQSMEKIQADMQALDDALAADVAALSASYDAQSEVLDQIVIRAKSTDIQINVFGLVWLPFQADSEKRLQPAWKV